MLVKFLEDAQTTTNKFDWNEIWNNVVTWCKTEGIRFLIAFLVLIVLLIIIKIIAKAIRRGLRKNPKTENFANAIYSAVKTVLNLLVIIIFLGYIGIDMAGISSIIASVSVAIGLAVQGSLSNIAGWIIILVNRPFKLGDFITAQGESGTVEEISLFYTHLKTPDNKVIFIPNGALSNGVITNVSIKESRRLEEVFSISYDDSPEKAISVIKSVLAKEKLILENPEPFVKVSKYADSSIDITVRVWVKSSDYWTVHWDLLQDVKTAFDVNNISVPYNQYDVNIIQTPNKNGPKEAKKINMKVKEIPTQEEGMEQSVLKEEITPSIIKDISKKRKKTVKKSK